MRVALLNEASPAADVCTEIRGGAGIRVAALAVHPR